MAKEFSYTINPNFDYILHEGPNTSINLRKISWSGREEKIDIRKYTYKDGEEIMGKGISLPDDAVNNLVETLVEHGYGSTSKIDKVLKQREDYGQESNEGYEDDGSEEYYDPMQLIS